MPLRQSRINFNQRIQNTSTHVLQAEKHAAKISLDKTNEPIEVDSDTIVVEISGSNPQLPTPSESATDASSQSSLADRGEISSKPAPKRAINVRKSKFREEAVDGPEPTAEDKNRSVSGETLVSKVSQSSLLQHGIKALDLGWTMVDMDALKKAYQDWNEEEIIVVDELAPAAKKAEEEAERLARIPQSNLIQIDMEAQKRAFQNLEEEMIEVIDSDMSDPGQAKEEAERLARTAARKSKMAQSAKKWEQRRETAEKNATRRSGRASLVVAKAGDMISGIANSVLGKRGRDASDDASKSTQGIVDSSEPAAKRARSNEDEKPLPPLPKKQLSSKDKKWLVSGLYAGQTRSFDARLSESGNKKKHDSKEAQPPAKENKVLPLPMFAGERLLKQGRDFRLPFDVFSPVPHGQGKPEGWRKQNRNVIIGDACDYWRSGRIQESSTCICTRETGCDHNCLNRTMYYECDSNNCSLPKYLCENRQWADLSLRVKLSQPYSIGVDVIKTSDRGHGVRANRTFEPGQIILEYTGEIITQEECERRMRTEYKTNECYYLMLFDQNMILDATKGSMARFVNHSCEPNCTMEKWTVNGVPRMALFAGDRGIMTGEELTYDYNFDPYSQKNVQQCRCGSAKCRGFLGPKPKDVKQKSPDLDGPKKGEGRIAGVKRKVAEVLSESTSQLNKKRKTEAAGKVHTKGSSPKKVIAVKKVTKKVVIQKGSSKALQKQKSTLKKIIDERKNKVASKSTRIISTGSMKEALLPNSGKNTANSPKRSSSLKEKASNLKKSVVQSVRGRNR